MQEEPNNIRGKDFYNDLISTDAGIYGAEPEGIAYYPLWEWFLNKIGFGRILDVGCGTGRFAKKATERGCSVTGVDFSGVAIEKARVYVPAARFICLDVEEPNADLFGLLHYDVVVFSEILEHIKDDLKLLWQVPKGKNIYLTVPNFRGDGHTRWFSSAGDVEERYGEALEIFDMTTHRKWFGLCGRRG